MNNDEWLLGGVYPVEDGVDFDIFRPFVGSMDLKSPASTALSSPGLLKSVALSYTKHS